MADAMTHHITQEIAQDSAIAAAVKAAPPVAVTGAVLSGLTLADWVAILTLAYLALQIGLLVPKYLDQFKAWRNARQAPSLMGTDEREGP